MFKSKKNSPISKKRILVLVETSRAFGRQIIDGITRYALETGDWIMFMEDSGLTDRNPFWLENFRGDGVISRTTDAELYFQLKSLKIPFVELLGDGVHSKSDILCDGRDMGELAANFFYEKGFRHFAYFSTGQSWWSEEFCTYYEQAVQKAGYFCHVNSLCREPSDAALPMSLKKGAERKIIRWLHSLPKPVGLFCPSDSQAIFILNLCQVAGIPVPHDIAVLGVENNETLCNAISPPLSSVVSVGNEVGYRAAALLEAMIERKPLPPRPILISPTSVMTRESTDLIAVADPDVSAAMHYISQNVLARITVKEVARHVDVSVRTLIRKFHDVLGHTPEEELMRMRMERAKLLLHDTDLTVSKIAQNIGYSSTKYFSKVFKQQTGLSPAQFRQNVRSQ